MINKKIQIEYSFKIKYLNKLNKSYYDNNNPQVSDQKYDELKKEILKLEKKYKFLKSNKSPSKIVGFKPSKNFKKSSHRVPMLSLANAFTKEDLINEMIASKEMYVARHYIEKKKWIPAINRLKFIVKEYDNTIFVEEALHRLVEIYYKIGLKEESRKYAILLGHNHPESKWYKKTYKIHQNNYKIKDIKKENKKTTLEKFKSLLD